MAISKELPGLVVHARSKEEINRKIPGAIKDVLEAQGCTVYSVTSADEILDDFELIGPHKFIAQTTHCEAAE